MELPGPAAPAFMRMMKRDGMNSGIGHEDTLSAASRDTFARPRSSAKRQPLALRIRCIHKFHARRGDLLCIMISTKRTLETDMAIVKGLVVAGLVGFGLLAMYANADSPAATSSATYYPSVGLPTLFRPMSH
jgi:hypothetical protein